MVSDKAIYVARNRDNMRKHGRRVLAARISNHDFQRRADKLGPPRRMKILPGSPEHVRMGYLVVRKLGTADEYETWMPTDVFEAQYRLHQEFFLEPKGGSDYDF